MNFENELTEILKRHISQTYDITPELLADLEKFCNFVWNEGYKDGVFDGRYGLTD